VLNYSSGAEKNLICILQSGGLAA